MNKNYKVVYSKARGKFVAVNEFARAFAGRAQASRSVSVSALMASLGAVVLAGGMPAGARDISGSGTVDTAGTLTIKADLDGDGQEDSITISGIGAGFIIPTQTTDKDKDGNPLILKGYGWRSANASETLGHDSIALGTNANAQGVQSIAIGPGAQAAGLGDSIAIGRGAEAGAGYWTSTAIGRGAKANGHSVNAIGDGAEANNGNSNAIGKKAKALNWAANAIGSGTEATGDSSNAIGNGAKAYADHAIAIGKNAQVSNTGKNSIAFGLDARASGESSFALGSGSTATEDNTVSVGSAPTNADPDGYRRRIVNVKAGTRATDAATVSQTATVESETGLLGVNGDSTNDNGSKRYKLSLKMGDLTAGSEEGLVTNTTVKAALANLSTTTASNYAAINASNLTGYEASWASVLGTGVIRPAVGTTQSSALLVTGKAVYDEVKLSRDGDYAKIGQTTGANLLALDDEIKKIVGQIAKNDTDLAEAKKEFQNKIDTVTEAAKDAQDTADKAVSDAAAAMTEAKKHTKVTGSGGIHVTPKDGDDGAYDVSIAEDADFTAKQTTWKSGGKVSTANASGFFSGGSSAADSDAYASGGIVSAGRSEATKIVLDGNTGKAAFGKTVTIDGSTGIISGVVAGEVSESSTDAVNGSQLYAAEERIAQNAEGLENLGREVNKVDRKINRTGALAAALAALHPQDYDENHPVSGAVGIGHYKGKQALAAGMFVRPVENFMVSLGASGSADDYMLNFGASFRFGGASMQKSPVQMATKLSDQEVTIRDLSAQNLAQKTRLESQDAKLDAQKAQLESQNAKLDRQAAEIEQLKALVAEIRAKLTK